MTIDQVLFALCDRKVLLHRRREVAPNMVKPVQGTDGLVAGRAADGTPIRGRIVGKSKARQLIEAAQRREEEAKARAAQKPARRGRKGA